jgi:hypothetical protein
MNAIRASGGAVIVPFFASEVRGLPVRGALVRRLLERDAHAQPHASDRQHETGTEELHHYASRRGQIAIASAQNAAAKNHTRA